MENNNEMGQALSAVSALKGVKSKQSEAAASSSFASSLAREAISTESDIALQIRKLVVDNPSLTGKIIFHKFSRYFV